MELILGNFSYENDLDVINHYYDFNQNNIENQIMQYNQENQIIQYNQDNQTIKYGSVNPSLFNKKYKNPTNNKFICEICNKEYKYFGGLYTHKRLHDPNYQKKYSCSLCNMSFDNTTHIKEHIHKHIRNGINASIIRNKRQLYRKNGKLT
jgi:hypothetical protein